MYRNFFPLFDFQRTKTQKMEIPDKKSCQPRVIEKLPFRETLEHSPGQTKPLSCWPQFPRDVQIQKQHLHLRLPQQRPFELELDVAAKLAW